MASFIYLQHLLERQSELAKQSYVDKVVKFLNDITSSGEMLLQAENHSLSWHIIRLIKMILIELV